MTKGTEMERNDEVQAGSELSAGLGALSQGASDVLAERQRQILGEGWTPEHDDQHDNGELASAAACYAYQAQSSIRGAPFSWPWDAEWWKPGDERRMLVKAGALILAEIERLDRIRRTPSSPNLATPD